MRKISFRKCPICENQNVEVLHRQHFVLPQGHPLTKEYDVVSCLRCDFIYADIPTVQKDYDTFYASCSKYEDKATASGGGISSWDARRLIETAEYLSNVWPDRTKSIVDVGCANGGLLCQLKKLGYKNLCGIDPSGLCIENTRALGVNAIVGSLLSLPENISSYDRVILSHVLEHIADLQGAIHSVHMQMAANGQIYVELPDASRYAETVFSPFQEFNTEHINHFSALTCANLMQSQGFVVRKQGVRSIETSPGKPYPVIYSVWLKDSSLKKALDLQRDSELKSKIGDYIAISQQMIGIIEKRLATIIKFNPAIILWGTGQLLMKLLTYTELKSARIVALVDGNPINQGKYLGEIPILAPEELHRFDSPILITTLLHQREISETIRRMGLPNEILQLL